MSQQQPPPPPGWYPDPADDQTLRWWDGTTWTAHTNADVVVEPDVSAGGRQVPAGLVVAVVAAVVVLGGMVVAALALRGQEPEPTVTADDDRPSLEEAEDPGVLFGTLRADDGPVTGASLRVEDPAGELVTSTSSDEQGSWEVEVPAGDYVVGVASLPGDVELRNPGRAEIEVSVEAGGRQAVPILLDGPGETEKGLSGPVAPDEYREEGVTLGIANEVPFGYVEDGEPTGIGPDVAQAVLHEMGIEVNDAEVVEFGELIGGLQAGQFDLVTAGMYITPERAEQVLFTDPDYCVQESLAVEESNPHDIEDYQSIVNNPDVTVAVASHTVEVDYAEDAGIPDDQIEIYGDIESMYQALEAGEVDAVTGTLATVQTQSDARDGIEALPGFFPFAAEGEEVLPCGGHAFRRDDQEFRDAFNEVLNEFREAGTTKQIITAYDDFTEADVEMANELTLDDFLK